MFKNSSLVKVINIVADLFILNLSFFLSAHFAQSLTLLFENELMFILLLILNLTWIFSINSTGIYSQINIPDLLQNYFKILKIIVAQVFTAIAFLFIIKEPLFLRNFLLYYTSFLVIILLLKNITMQSVSRLLIRKGIDVRNILVIGTNENSANLQKYVSKNSFMKIIGFLGETSGYISKNIIGDISQLDNILIGQKVDDVIISLPNSDYTYFDEIVRICNYHAVKIHVIPDFNRYIFSNFEINILNDLPLITLRKEPLAEFHWRFLKRATDIIISLLVVLLIFPWLFPILIIIQKLTSRGPVFYIQKRVGYLDRTFNCYKFRSMAVSNEPESLYSAITESKSRITKFGSFLRKTNMDELPQFINVLFGQMTVVGPRPNAFSFHQTYKNYIDEYNLRRIVKPGITGWAQIHGLRGDLPDEEENKKRIIKRFEYDLWYIENWSFKLDIQIILFTVVQIFRRKV